jgi:hypothetical protein
LGCCNSSMGIENQICRQAVPTRSLPLSRRQGLAVSSEMGLGRVKTRSPLEGAEWHFSCPPNSSELLRQLVPDAALEQSDSTSKIRRRVFTQPRSRGRRSMRDRVTRNLCDGSGVDVLGEGLAACIPREHCLRRLKVLGTSLAIQRANSMTTLMSSARCRMASLHCVRGTRRLISR